MYEVLNEINGAEDVKKLSLEELEILAEDIREALFNRLTKVGGHFGPNFGMVEAEIALHYVFDSPKDKIIFDVSHQSYPHKIITGRKNGYIVDEDFGEDSGYTNPDESEHDLFNVGHTSTSVSLATGMAKARDLLGGEENVIAVIGDGSLSGGEALEGLNVAGSEIKSNLIIVVNDNQQSISETHGGIYRNLKELRETKGKSENNFFKAFGLDYIYTEDGNDIENMIRIFEEVKDIDHPIVVHMNTVKGKGYEPAVENREYWHWTMPFDRDTGKPFVDLNAGETYTNIAKKFILEKAKQDSSFVAITPNMPGSFAMSQKERESMGEQFVDVGIAEEQAAAMASGAAKAGAKPLVFTNVTFMQRAYDQISHDICINKNPVTILLNHASFNTLRDVTHLGIFGIAEFSNIPNLVVLCPSSKEELLGMLDWSVEQRRHPVMILMPGNKVSCRPSDNNYDIINKFRVERKGKKLAILGLGDFFQMGEALAEAVKERFGFEPTVINPRFASGVDAELLEKLKENHEAVITLEDGILDGGFGQKIASFYGTSDMKVKNYGLKKEFYDRYNPKELLASLGMDKESMLGDIGTLISL
ncbi:MAG: 1-deoxy-D-xylulose-5-phosphate synthase [Hornefia sp.]|nr:1-deoxy-D-xylulose-5-phosphate synthase [Hornefia sp.]